MQFILALENVEGRGEEFNLFITLGVQRRKIFLGGLSLTASILYNIKLA